jgi:hypothetical protein
MKEQPMSDEKPMGQVIQIDEARIRDHLGEMVRGTVEETLNASWMLSVNVFASRQRRSKAASEVTTSRFPSPLADGFLRNCNWRAPCSAKAAAWGMPSS